MGRDVERVAPAPPCGGWACVGVWWWPAFESVIFLGLSQGRGSRHGVRGHMGP